MATVKKSTTKKPVKSPAVKTSAAKKAPVKKTAASKATTKAVAAKKPAAKTSAPRTSTKRSAARQPEMRSFRISHEPQQFTHFQITKQTVYWIILVAFIIFVQLWILKLQVEVATLLDAQQAQLSEQI